VLCAAAKRRHRDSEKAVRTRRSEAPKLAPAPLPVIVTTEFARHTLPYRQGEAKMAEQQIPLNFHAHLRQEPDQSFTIVVEISGIPSIDMADRVSKWLQTAIRENAEKLDDVDTPPRRH